jgi:hypothetical protein
MPKFGEAIKILPGFNLPTPFGTLHLTDIELPPLARPKLNEEEKKAMRLAIGSDLAMIPGEIPIIGDFLENALVHIHRGEIVRHLKPEQQRQFLEYAKGGPDSIALLRLFLKEKGIGK